MTIDLAKLPPVLPVSVSRVTADGKPTKATIDWEQYYREFVRGSIGTLQIRTDQVQADVTTLSTTVSGNTASITTLNASVGGVLVKYGVQGSINGVTGGFVFSGVLKNDGSVSYNMEFQSNVTIYGNLLVAGTITTAKAASNAFTRAASTVASGASTVSLVMACRAGAVVLVRCVGNPNAAYQSGTPSTITCSLYAGSTLLGSPYVDTVVRDTPNASAPVSGSVANVTYSTSWKITNFVVERLWTCPADGNYTFEATLSSQTSDLTLTTTELAR